MVIKKLLLKSRTYVQFCSRSAVRAKTVISSPSYRLKVCIVTHYICCFVSMTCWWHWFRTSLQVMSQTKTNSEEYPAHDTLHIFSATLLAPHFPEH